MSFSIGQKVVCVWDDWSGAESFYPGITLPRKGRFYHVNGNEYNDGGTLYRSPTDASREWVAVEGSYVTLCEIPIVDGDRIRFLASCFRPVTERKTDITVFKKLLIRPPAKVTVPVGSPVSTGEDEFPPRYVEHPMCRCMLIPIKPT